MSSRNRGPSTRMIRHSARMRVPPLRLWGHHHLFNENRPQPDDGYRRANSNSTLANHERWNGERAMATAVKMGGSHNHPAQDLKDHPPDSPRRENSGAPCRAATEQESSSVLRHDRRPFPPPRCAHEESRVRNISSSVLSFISPLSAPKPGAGIISRMGRPVIVQKKTGGGIHGPVTLRSQAQDHTKKSSSPWMSRKRGDKHPGGAVPAAFPSRAIGLSQSEKSLVIVMLIQFPCTFFSISTKSVLKPAFLTMKFNHRYAVGKSSS